MIREGYIIGESVCSSSPSSAAEREGGGGGSRERSWVMVRRSAGSVRSSGGRSNLWRVVRSWRRRSWMAAGEPDMESRDSLSLAGRSLALRPRPLEREGKETGEERGGRRAT